MAITFHVHTEFCRVEGLEAAHGHSSLPFPYWQRWPAFLLTMNEQHGAPLTFRNQVRTEAPAEG